MQGFVPYDGLWLVLQVQWEANEDIQIDKLNDLNLCFKSTVEIVWRTDEQGEKVELRLLFWEA